MKIPLLDGRDFRQSDVDPSVAIVNETFAKIFFNGENPIGKSFEKTYPKRNSVHIIGLTRDARYNEMKEFVKPVVYVPFHGGTMPREDCRPSATRPS